MGTGRIVACMLVRDESDIIGDAIEFHLNNGVDFIIITDHCSIDGTADICRKFDNTHLILESGPLLAADLRTKMVNIAYEMGAEWCVPIDPDERWVGVEKLLELPDFIQIAILNRSFEYPPVQNAKQEYWIIDPRTLYFWSLSNLDQPAKKHNRAAYRVLPNLKVTHGRMPVDFQEMPEIIINFIKLHHYPIRTYQQFERRVKLHGEAYEELARTTDLDKDIGYHRRSWYNSYLKGKLSEVFGDKLLKIENISSLLKDGYICQQLDSPCPLV